MLFFLLAVGMYCSHEYLMSTKKSIGILLYRRYKRKRLVSQHPPPTYINNLRRKSLCQKHFTMPK